MVVPTGNFGNILAAYFAKKMGLPIRTLICASNDNKVLYDFFTTGTYDRRREFILTNSPSMDILISSNLERLIYLSTGSDPKANAALMKELAVDGHYTITDEMRAFRAVLPQRRKMKLRYGPFSRIQAISSTHIQAWQRPYTDSIKRKQAIRQRRLLRPRPVPLSSHAV